MTDLHVHTTFSDGRSTPEEVVQAAVAKGMTTLGFSDHSYTPFDTRYCIPKEQISNYLDTIHALQEKYKDQITILCGIEEDFYSGKATEAFDYVIGSVHYLRCGDEYIPVDEGAEILRDAARRRFHGDIYALIAEYYRTVSLLPEQTGATIIGHFDLISKYNESGTLFDESDPRYIEAWQSAADRLLTAGIPFEINTGAISRGYRSTPYPAAPIRAYLQARGAKFRMSSDSHRASTLCYGFAQWSKENKDAIIE